jgi:hypothetical protein
VAASTAAVASSPQPPTSIEKSGKTLIQSMLKLYNLIKRVLLVRTKKLILNMKITKILHWKILLCLLQNLILLKLVILC